jgi:Ca2+-binding RTX toxin-like protein
MPVVTMTVGENRVFDYVSGSIESMVLRASEIAGAGAAYVSAIRDPQSSRLLFTFLELDDPATGSTSNGYFLNTSLFGIDQYGLMLNEADTWTVDDQLFGSGIALWGGVNTDRISHMGTGDFYFLDDGFALNPTDNGSGGDNYEIDLSQSNYTAQWSGFNIGRVEFLNASLQFRQGNFAPLNTILNSYNYNMVGGSFDDVIFGYALGDTLRGGGGNDSLDGKAGADIIFGDDGNDTILGGAGDDVINGGTGTNVINGGANNDVYIIGNATGIDYISDDSGFDTVRFTNSSMLDWTANQFDGDLEHASFGQTYIERYEGSAGDDVIRMAVNSTLGIQIDGKAGNDLLAGGAANDLIFGDDGADFIYGRNGNDALDGGIANDQLFGEGGNDILRGGFGNDVINGGLGSDTAMFEEHFGASSRGWTIDLIRQTATTRLGGLAGLSFTETDTLVGIENVVASAGNDLIYASGINDIDGMGGTDTLYLAPTARSATSFSGFTNAQDFVYLANPGEIVEGVLTESTSTRASSILLGGIQVESIEIVTFRNIEAIHMGTGNDNFYGNRLDNIAFGDEGNDELQGNDGNDQLYGGTGADELDGGDGIDYARYDDANHGNLTIRLDAPSLNTGAAAGDTYFNIEGLVGGAGQDLIVGNASVNYLFGGGGNDNVYGQAGADYLNGGAGTNNLFGGAGADEHFGLNGTDFARYDDANWGNLTIRLDGGANVGAVAVGDTYNGIEGLVGGLGNDVIVGNASNNFLFGSGGADYIDARAGSDYLNGGAGADRFVFATALGATNVDTIADFAHAVDDIVLSQAIFAGIGATLDASEFQIGMANAATDRIIYNNTTGQLFYDSNGNGAGGMTQFATVTAGTVLDIGDFVMV